MLMQMTALLGNSLRRRFKRHLELVLANIFLDFMQLLNSVSPALVDGPAVLWDGVQMALHHALHKTTVSFVLCVIRSYAQTG